MSKVVRKSFCSSAGRGFWQRSQLAFPPDAVSARQCPPERASRCGPLGLAPRCAAPPRAAPPPAPLLAAGAPASQSARREGARVLSQRALTRLRSALRLAGRCGARATRPSRPRARCCRRRRRARRRSRCAAVAAPQRRRPSAAGALPLRPRCTHITPAWSIPAHRASRRPAASPLAPGSSRRPRWPWTPTRAAPAAPAARQDLPWCALHPLSWLI